MSALRPGWVAALLLVAVLASALAVVYSTHRSRLLFNEWQQRQREAWALNEEWERLLLEQGAWAAHERVRNLAERQLDMVTPKAGSMRVIGPDGDE